MSRRFYITTAIDYVNGRPHLGHTYEKVAADALARYHRLLGEEVCFLTGTDEHGTKVARAAEADGMDVQAFVDRQAAAFRAAWDALDVSYDVFVRTTEDRHARAVQQVLERIRDRGDDLFEGTYEGWYCVGCEAYKPDKDLVDGRCPDHPTLDPRWVKEDNLFFRLSRFRDGLLAHLEANPGFVQPETRRNEVLAVLRGGLEDLSVSREGLGWGVPIPFRPGATVYVWFDALVNYVSGLGFADGDERFRRFWPADLHLVGKDITRFHCIIWPAMLLAAGLELPRAVYGHGWVLATGGQRESKSAGNVTDPVALAEQYGPDPVRYFLLGAIPFGKDGEFSRARLEEKYTSALANELGNLLSRTLNMAEKYRAGVPDPDGRPEPGIEDLCARATFAWREAMDRHQLDEGLQAAWNIVSTLNNLIQSREPWKVAKDPARERELSAFLYALCEGLRIAAVLLQPFVPRTARAVLERVGAPGDYAAPVAVTATWGRLVPGTAVVKGEPLFPRLPEPA